MTTIREQQNAPSIPEGSSEEASRPAGGNPTRGGAGTVSEEVNSLPLNPVGVWMSEDHRYWWNGEGPNPSVTTVLEIMSKPAVTTWKAQETAKAIIENWPTVCDLIANTGQDSAVKWAVQKSDEARDTAAKIGSGVHLLADMVPRASETAIAGFQISEREMPYIEAFRGFLAFLGAQGAKIISSEKAVWSLNGYAGTYDLLVQMPREDWQCQHPDDQLVTSPSWQGHMCGVCGLLESEWAELWLIDIKTSKGFYPEYGLQLAAYRWADYIVLPGDPRPYPMPMVHRTGILHLRPEQYSEGWKLIEYPTAYDLDYLPFLGLLEAYRWQKQGRFTKSKLVGRQSPGYQKPVSGPRKRQEFTTHR